MRRSAAQRVAKLVAQAGVSVTRRRTAMGDADQRGLYVATYNVLCPVYGVKWAEREACLDHKAEERASNWDVRWPALKRNLALGRWDVVCIQEAQDVTRRHLEQAATEMEMEFCFVPHQKRKDALAMMYRPSRLELVKHDVRDFCGSSTGLLELRDLCTDATLRVLCTHQRGGKPEQMADLMEYAEAEPAPGCTIVCGDFNEDFNVTGNHPAGYAWANRADRDLSAVSRPDHKQGDDQTSGKGKVDWIFVKGGTVEYDDVCVRAVVQSHVACPETFQWPSDHGLECGLVKPDPRSA
mmetsp:Transcript_6009/g.14353  ORF Transcript_6009/g.14353 Transcript_6009/m.14353 type:complete len:296 (+) Transcript_6009:11-898(+)